MKLTKLLFVLLSGLLILGCSERLDLSFSKSENVIVAADRQRSRVIIETRASSYSVFSDTDDVSKLKDPGYLEAIRAESPSGSAFAVSSDGLILTNMHVVKSTNFCTAKDHPDGLERRAKKQETYCILVTQQSTKVYRAKLIAVDEKNDIAVLKIEKLEVKIPFLRLANPGTFSDGAEVLTIGNPFGNTNVMTPGYLSNLDFVMPDKSGDRKGPRKIQFSAPILPGNSGGPLVSAATGEVVGQVVSIFAPRGMPTQMSYANPVEFLVEILRSVPAPAK